MPKRIRFVVAASPIGLLSAIGRASATAYGFNGSAAPGATSTKFADGGGVSASVSRMAAAMTATTTLREINEIAK